MSDIWMDLLKTVEDLDPELVPYMEKGGPLGRCIRHPLVYSMIHTDQMNAIANRQLAAKKEAVAEAREQREWARFIFLHERPYRIEAFMEIEDQLTDSEYWDHLGSVWVDTENAYQNPDEWMELLTSNRSCREMMSCEDVRGVFSLPPEKGGLLDETIIYRGYRGENGLYGNSWTLDKARVRWFATRFPDAEPAFVAKGKVRKGDVIAYITGRDEQEIVCLAETVIDLSIEEVSPRAR